MSFDLRSGRSRDCKNEVPDVCTTSGRYNFNAKTVPQPPKHDQIPPKYVVP